MGSICFIRLFLRQVSLSGIFIILFNPALIYAAGTDSDLASGNNSSENIKVYVEPEENEKLTFGGASNIRLNSFLKGDLRLPGFEGKEEKTNKKSGRYVFRSQPEQELIFPLQPFISAETKKKGKKPAIDVSFTKKGPQPLPLNFAVNEQEGVVKVKPARQSTPGLYTFKAGPDQALSDGAGGYSQQFAWGLLAMNTDKDQYQPGETAAIHIGVIDSKGYIICNASLLLRIISPTGAVTELSTENKTIEITGTCGKMEAGFIDPDYQAFLQLNESGIYKFNLLAETSDGSWKLERDVMVNESAPFMIKRIAATRLWPFAPSPMTIKIHFNKNYKGTISDIVPGGFEIVSSSPKAQISFVSDQGETSTKITWKGNWKAGKTISLSYIYDAPDVSPEFYLVGPLEFGDVYTEQRQWQIVNDDVGDKIYIDNGGTGYTAFECYNRSGTGYLGDYLLCKPDNTGGWAKWEFTSLAEGTYSVAVSYFQKSTWTDSAEYTVNWVDLAGSPQSQTYYIDERYIANDIYDQNIWWEYLGTSFTVQDDSTLSVVLSDYGNGVSYITGDAARLEMLEELGPDDEDFFFFF